ncbi:MAG: hypothetical protein H7Y42_03290 [Chitinophagaceae bacterium]|nr:hypothetical protein [Chitinophagaceae bacterium]
MFVLAGGRLSFTGQKLNYATRIDGIDEWDIRIRNDETKVVNVDPYLLQNYVN